MSIDKIRLKTPKQTFTCEFYKEGRCLKDNKDCYLKKIYDEGLCFDCIKKIY